MPNVVKGSKQEKMIVVPHRPARRALYATVFILAAAASAIGGFMYGYYETILTQETTLASTEELSSELAVMQAENSELQRQVAILDRSSVMDQRATEEVQSTISTLREQVAQLEQDIVYYRQVVSDETQDTGLTIANLDINAMQDPNRFRYKLELRQQDADGDTFLLGHVNINLIGDQEGEQVILALRDLSEEQDELDIRLRFKYFQNIEGQLTLPEGFVAQRVQVAAVSVEPVDKSIDQDFAWVVSR